METPIEQLMDENINRPNGSVSFAEQPNPDELVEDHDHDHYNQQEKQGSFGQGQPVQGPFGQGPFGQGQGFSGIFKNPVEFFTSAINPDEYKSVLLFFGLLLLVLLLNVYGTPFLSKYPFFVSQVTQYDYKLTLVGMVVCAIVFSLLFFGIKVGAKI